MFALSLVFYFITSFILSEQFIVSNLAYISLLIRSILLFIFIWITVARIIIFAASLVITTTILVVIILDRPIRLVQRELLVITIRCISILNNIVIVLLITIEHWRWFILFSNRIASSFSNVLIKVIKSSAIVIALCTCWRSLWTISTRLFDANFRLLWCQQLLSFVIFLRL